MRIVERYSHWNGLEYLLVRKPHLWREIQEAITSVDAAAFTAGAAQKEMSKAIDGSFSSRGWEKSGAAMPNDPSRKPGFVKERVAVDVQFGGYPFDLFVKHMAFFIGDVIDLGVEILPMKALQAEMSSGPGYYEGELYNLLRQGRGTPAVPLVVVGVAP